MDAAYLFIARSIQSFNIVNNELHAQIYIQQM